MKILLATCLVTLTLSALCQTNELQQAYSQGMQAYKDGDYKTFYSAIMKAHQIHPYHQGILYQAGIAAALNNKPDEAVGYLKKAVLIQNDFNLDVPDLQPLNTRSDFKALKKLQEEYRIPVIASDTLFTLKDRSLHVESVCAGEANGVYYAACLHGKKIVRIENGVSRDFITSAQGGIGPVFSVRVDTRKKILWAASSPMPDFNDTTSPRSALYKYDIKTGKLLAKYEPADQSKTYVLGDIALSSKGEVYVSDSKNSFIFKLDESKKVLEQYYSDDQFWNIQGITFSDDDKFLYVSDYIKGIFRLEVKPRYLEQLKCNLDVSLKGIDGLLFYENSLIAIQNGVKPLRVTRLTLSKAGDAVTAFRVLESNHPAFNEPTNGTIAGSTLVYVANSQWSGYDNQNQPKPDNQLQDIVVLQLGLK